MTAALPKIEQNLAAVLLLKIMLVDHADNVSSIGWLIGTRMWPAGRSLPTHGIMSFGPGFVHEEQRTAT